MKSVARKDGRNRLTLHSIFGGKAGIARRYLQAVRHPPKQTTPGKMIEAGTEVVIFKSTRHRRRPTAAELAIVCRAGPVCIELNDGRKFATIGGHGLNTDGYILEARR